MPDEKSALQKSIENKLTTSLTPQNKIDAAALRRNNAPLAAVLDEFVEAKTTRDDPETFAKDLARTLEGRTPDTRLANALAALEAHMKQNK